MTRDQRKTAEKPLFILNDNTNNLSGIRTEAKTRPLRSDLAHLRVVAVTSGRKKRGDGLNGQIFGQCIGSPTSGQALKEIKR